ncbi:aconitate hydratase [Salinibacter ruber]|uniref:Aconitate hydratase, putative n=1 Tax=Salinibacter ruber (strain DSM 13855 / M31) TaxID=309807 RepID=Q2S2I0_SALRD|nr:aconitate hydratase [Salinibacter ruber]ABC44618.1 aconitate hydratase, putative [Salinibacter ruber DSM 13855]MCS3629639.1 aconitate hydratase [Salinibacter ruber]MCS3641686.1 aconitate hydratase [Salinibacter ruber]MCS3667357.1 aconitate hydratase [Salinibacter ruber]MCS4101942.1 aconitate hydratase [Salinibacter ruber]
MGKNVAEKLIDSHLADGRFEDVEVGKEIDLEMDQTLTQDATGTMVMLEFEAMGIPRVQTELSAQYVDHNLIQSDFKNPDDHLFLRSACKKFGAWYSRPGNGVSHPVHQERFGEPGKTLIGSDSHSPAAGAIGMLAIGAGGLDVAMAMAGKPYTINMPEVWGVKLTGELPDWVSAKDVILTMLERHDVDGGVGQIIEYYGPGLDSLSCMDRHVIANMGTELGATSTVFPSDDEVRAFLRRQGREEVFEEIKADEDADYDEYEEINLSELEPKIAKPSSPGNVVPVREVEGQEIYQSYVGSSANPGFRDFASAAEIVDGRQVHDRVSFDVNPTSRQILENLMNSGHLQMLTRAGARIHQAGCNGCIGMGQAPATGQISVRTVPRNFPGRSGTKEDAVYLVSPETAAASALTGEITDPRDLADLYDMEYPNAETPDQISVNTDQLVEPLSAEEAKNVDLEKGPNVVSLPEFEPLQNSFDLPVLLKVGDDISTDEIMPAGSRILPYRSNIPKISEFVFEQVDESFFDRAMEHQDNGFAVVGGTNYGQGSSREHAAIAPRWLGTRVKIAKSYARIHRQNLANFGILPLLFKDDESYDSIDQGDTLQFRNLREQVQSGTDVELTNADKDETYVVEHDLSDRELKMVLEGSQISVVKKEFAGVEA